MLDTVTPAGKELSLTAVPEELHLKLDLAVLESDVTYAVMARRVDDEVFLDGTILYSVRFSCARCLEEFLEPFSNPLSIVIQLVGDAAAVEDGDQGQFVVFPESKKVFNLDQHLRDLITLELPMKPICKADCLGLCPKCGANLNESRCDCKTEGVDPRWEGLRKLANNKQELN